MTAPLTRLTAPIGWRVPGHDARRFHSFGLAEHGSSLDLRAAAAATPSADRRAQYLRHALDEARHARLFAERSAALRRARGRGPLGPGVADFEWLYETLGEVRFLAFVVLGEARASRQFRVHHDWFAAHGRPEDAAMLTGILADEAHHERYARALLVELAGGKGPARAALRWARWWEAWRTWRRLGSALAQRLYFVLMTALYLTLIPFVLLVLAVRPLRPGWAPRAPREEA